MLAIGEGLGVAVAATVLGMEATPVRVEVSVTSGLPAFTVVGLPDASIHEAKERVRAAILSSGRQWPMQRIVVNLSPAHVRKVGSGFDLAIALGILVADRQIPPGVLDRTAALAELSLDGAARPIRGVLSAATRLAEAGVQRLFVSVGNAAEASIAGGLGILPVDHLARCLAILEQGADPLPVPPAPPTIFHGYPDLADVRGNMAAKRALEIAAAGEHNLLMTGAPGAGKTMLAQRLPGILPPLQQDEAVEVTRIHSIAGLLPEGAGLVGVRPFRAPHHSATVAALVGGGGAVPLPGEVSLAHRGVLFLDELGEFDRRTIQSLRQPMEEGWVRIVRARWAATFPARTMIVAATNPCPCGFRGVEHRACRCPDSRIVAYAERLSGPVLDRIDLQVAVPPTSGEELLGGGDGEASAQVGIRVREARRTQRRRWAPHGFLTNAELPAKGMVELAGVEPSAQRLLSRAVDDEGLSGRAAHRVIRVARTISDLAGLEAVSVTQIREALTLRVAGSHP
ncbi:MAG: YifB family Mg chelatase-like AAA ATPase [Actinomycetota bacterium]